MGSLKRLLGQEDGPRYPSRSNANKVHKTGAARDSTKLLTKVAGVMESLISDTATAFEEKASAESDLSDVLLKEKELIEQLDASQSMLALQKHKESIRNNKLSIASFNPPYIFKGPFNS